MQTVFYSWQSDLPNSTNRGFIQGCLEKAIKELKAEGTVAVEPALDRDTEGRPGSPDIADTIFEKIDNCSAFVADVSFINGCTNNTSPAFATEGERCSCTRLTPNPNVIAEWGRATRSVDFNRIICVLNETTGDVEDLPFDLRKRRILTYRLTMGEEKADQRKLLVGSLKKRLREVLDMPRVALDLQFADSESEKELGTTITLEGVLYSPLPKNQIPKFQKEIRSVIGTTEFVMIPGIQANTDYYVEKADYLVHSRLTRPVAFIVSNVGEQLLRNVRLNLTVPRYEGGGLVMLNKRDMPELPNRYSNPYNVSPGLALRNVLRASNNPGAVEVRAFDDRFKVEVDFGDVQAKASVFTDIFYVGAIRSRQVELVGGIYSDDFSEPQEVALFIDFETTERTMTLNDLRQLLPEEPRYKDDD